MGRRGHFLFCWPPILESHNLLARTPIRVFLDSTESPLSIESGHMPMNGIWCPHISENLIVAPSVEIA